ncbi:MAG: hypothetical protein ABI389_02920 [Rhodanobacter sp.]
MIAPVAPTGWPGALPLLLGLILAGSKRGASTHLYRHDLAVEAPLTDGGHRAAMAFQRGGFLLRALDAVALGDGLHRDAHPHLVEWIIGSDAERVDQHCATALAPPAMA